MAEVKERVVSAALGRLRHESTLVVILLIANIAQGAANAYMLVKVLPEREAEIHKHCMEMNNQYALLVATKIDELKTVITQKDSVIQDLMRSLIGLGKN